MRYAEIQRKLLPTFACVLACACASQARTIHVDPTGGADFTTIQPAIDDSTNGDEIIIHPGTYTGPGNRDIDFKGKAITIRSTDPNVVQATVIDCNEQGRGFYLNGCPGATITGLTITNGFAQAGGAICAEHSNLRIYNCHIQGNTAVGSGGGAIYCVYTAADIEGTYIIDNSTGTCCEDSNGESGGAIYCKGSTLNIWATDIIKNSAGLGGWGGRRRRWRRNMLRGFVDSD